MNVERARMPNDLILVRHGESEANVAHRKERHGHGKTIPPEFYDLHDWEYRLSKKGVIQAQKAGAWLTEHVAEISDFDLRYVSPFMRARETAVNLGGTGCQWLVDGRLKERDWGIYGATPLEERKALFARTDALRERSSWYTRLDGGESLADNVMMRVRDWFDTLHRDGDSKRVLAVAHGEFMWTVRAAMEYMLPEEWNVVERDRTQKLANCAILWYSRVNPEDKTDIAPYIKWRRIIYPDKPDRSPFEGQWQELPGKRRMTTEELSTSVETVERIF